MTPAHRPQATDYARALSSSLSADSELWSAYPRAAARFAPLAWPCCADAVRALSRHPDTGVAGDALFAMVTHAEDAEARQALERLERLHPKGALTREARRFLGGLRRGQRAPDFRLVETGTNQRVQLEQFRGSHVLLCFLTITPRDAEAIIPMLVRADEEYGKRGLKLVSVALEPDGATPRRLITAAGVEAPGLQTRAEAREHEAMAEAFGILGLPSFVLLDPEGRVAATNAELLRDGLGPTLEKRLDDPQR